jgi:pyruvate,water dikinase
MISFICLIYFPFQSVVSSTAEPDTITLSVDVNDNSFDSRNISGIESIIIGSKHSSIRMKESGTYTSNETSDKSSNCCVSEDLALKLGRVILKVQQYLGSVRDIEWGVKNNKIYLLQSRPLTNLNLFSEWELMHELDSPHLSNNDYSTRANIGEVIPGSCSYLSLTSVQNISAVCSFVSLILAKSL